MLLNYKYIIHYLMQIFPEPIYLFQVILFPFRGEKQVHLNRT